MKAVLFNATGAGIVSWLSDQDYTIPAVSWAPGGATCNCLLSTNPTITTATLPSGTVERDVIAFAQSTGSGSSTSGWDLPDFPLLKDSWLFASFSAAAKMVVYLKPAETNTAE